MSQDALYAVEHYEAAVVHMFTADCHSSLYRKQDCVLFDRPVFVSIKTMCDAFMV